MYREGEFVVFLGVYDWVDGVEFLYVLEFLYYLLEMILHNSLILQTFPAI